MRTRTLGLAALAFALGGCATTSDAGAADGAPSNISYRTGPCFGACPVYSVTVDADGVGRFEGRDFTAVEGERAFRVTPAQFREFAAHLAPLRPENGDVRYAGERCGIMATDLPSAEVTWTTQAGESRSLYFYFGCDMDRNRAIAERLRAAPGLLPIGEMIGRPGERAVERR